MTTLDRAPLICLDRASRIFGQGENQVVALHELTLRISAGRMVALIGRSGSGKSTLLNLLGAVDRPTGGKIAIDGVDLGAQSNEALALFRRRRLGYVFQSFHLIPSLTAFDNIAVTWMLDRALTAERKRKILDLLDRLGLCDKAQRYPDELSGGQQQRIALARAIIHEPALLLADEPTGNLDARSGRDILDLLQEINRQRKLTIVMATHAPEAAERCADSLTLEDGRVAGVRGEILAENPVEAPA